MRIERDAMYFEPQSSMMQVSYTGMEVAIRMFLFYHIPLKRSIFVMMASICLFTAYMRMI